MIIVTNDSFIKKAKDVHGDKYDYSLIDYKDSKTKVSIICKKHGIFYQCTNSHLNGHGCSECSNNLKMTTEKFIEKCDKVHNYKFDYSLVQYENNHIKIKIICPIHGVFDQRASSHKRGVGCKKCSDESIRYNALDTEKFIEKSKNIHGDKYDYSLSEYTGVFNNIKIICKVHGVFEQLPNNHFKKLGCPKCSGIKKLTQDEFIEKSRLIHSNKFDYSLVQYKNNRKKVKIICPNHGVFEQEPSSHMNNGAGCPFCLNSKGEVKIKNILDNYKLEYIQQYKFKDCKDKNKLAFDFYIPEKNICIEYDGKQHFEPIKRFGGSCGFEIVKKHDIIKNKYCYSKNIKLFRIKYDENIEEKLKEMLFLI